MAGDRLNFEGKNGEFCVGSAVVHPWHLDQLGHMNVRWYAHFFDDASFQFLEIIGVGPSARDGLINVHCVTAQSTTQYKSELLAGTCVKVIGHVKRIGRKSMSLHYRMVGSVCGTEYAVCETVDVFVNADTHQSVEIPDVVRRVLVRHSLPGGTGPC
ncbi:MAG: thioesterase family protein [Roseovarius sp.]